MTTIEREELARLRRENRPYQFIAVDKAQHSVAQLCRVLQVASSGDYAWRHRRPSWCSQTNALLMNQIRAVHAHSRCTYGAPRIHAELQAGTSASRASGSHA